MASIYERNGGFAVIGRVVMDFYDRLLDSDVVGPYFDNVDMKRLIDHQTKFVASITGGPAEFTEARLVHAHQNLGIEAAEFEEMARLLDETLADHGFNDEDRKAVVAEIESRRGQIIGI